MRKLPSIVVLGTVATLLAGCSTAPADEPEAASTSATTASSSSSISSGTRSTAATPTPTVAPSRGPSSEPAPTQEEGVPGESTPPTIEVPPAKPEDAVVPPAATESAVVTPDPQWGAASISVTQGSSFTINGSSYQPGQRIAINIGIAQSDGFVMDEQYAYVNNSGNYSFMITIAPDLEPRTYGVLTYISAGKSGPDFEASKRFAIIEVIAP